jgi:heme/copper-type cytochrome/quinol oxidase subunit 4
LSKLTVEVQDDVHLRAAEMLAEVQVTLDLVCFLDLVDTNAHNGALEEDEAVG